MTENKISKLFITIVFAVAIIIECVAGKQESSNPALCSSNKNYYHLIKNIKSDESSPKNLIVNGSFENFNLKTGKFEGWSDWKKQFSPSVKAASGNRSVKVALSEITKWSKTTVRGLLVYPIALTPGTYSFSCAVKGKNLTAVRIRLLPVSGVPSKSASKTFRLKGQNTEDWKIFTTILKVPENIAVQRMTMEIHGVRGKAYEAFVDDVKLEKQSAKANVLFNSSFEICTVPGCPDRWFSIIDELGYSEKYNTTMVSDMAKTGSNSIKMSWHGPYDKVIAYYSRLMSGYYTCVSEGEKYTFSFWMKTNNPPVKMTLRLMIPENDKTFVVDSKEWKKYTITGIWQNSKRRKIPFAFIMLLFAGEKGEMIDADVWVDDIMAQPGEIATAWSPAPEDKLYLDKMFDSAGKSALKSIKTSNCPQVTARKCKKEAIAVDGKLDEAIWSGKNAVQCNASFKKIPVSNQTICKVAYDEDYLYLGLDAKRETAKSPLKQSNSAFSDDWVEIFLDPDSSDCLYYQLAINRKGNIFTSKCLYDTIAFEIAGSKGFTLIPWRPKFDHAVSRDKNGWKAEIKIPLNLFGRELASDKPFKLNFFRVIPATGEANCWSRPKNGFHDLPLFGSLDGLKVRKRFAEVDFSNIRYLPSPDGKNIVGKLSLCPEDAVEDIGAEIVDTYLKAQKLPVSKENNTYNINIPYSVHEAENKLMRFTAKIGDDKIQAFSTVKISKLLTFGLASLVFRRENFFPCLITVNLSESEQRYAVLSIAATDRKSGKKAITREFVVKSAKDMYKLPVLNLKNGWYNLEVTLKLHGKVAAAETKWTYLGKFQKNYTRTSVKNMRIERNGRPFFVRSIFHALRNPECDVGLLKKYRHLKLNTVGINLASYFSKHENLDFDLIFDEAEKAGIAIIPDMTKLLEMGERKHKYSKQKILDIIKSFVIKYRNRPSLLFYHGMDEPYVMRHRGRPFSSEKELEKLYWLVKTLDPYHPFYNNLEPRTRAWINLNFTDIFSYDCYIESPTPYETNMERFLYYIREGKKYAERNGKPMFNVVQFSSSTEIVKTRLLRYNEQRCLAYLAILNNSKGIVFYTGLNWCEPKNQHLLSISEELEKLAPVLLEYERQGQIETGTKDIEAKYFEYDGNVWIICANNSSKSLNKVKLKVDGILLEGQILTPVFNGKKTSIKNGKLEIDFSPYECFIYKAGK